MQAGVIHIVESDTEKLSSFRETVPLPNDHRFDELTQALDVTQNLTLSDGRTAQKGRAAVEEPVEAEDVQITEDEISEYMSDDIITRYTEFLFLPGKFLAVSSSSGNFAVDLINQYTPIDVTPAIINLDGYLQEKRSDTGGGESSDLDPWKVGFYSSHGLAENGVVHGSSLLNDEDVGGLLDVSNKNQLGLDYEYEENNVRVFAAESGYIEVYQPSNYDSKQFVKFTDDEILPHLLRE